MKFSNTFALASMAGVAMGKIALDPMRHDIKIVDKKSFPIVISKNRDNVVAATWYYWPNENEDFVDTWNNVAKKTKDMVTISAMDCTGQNAKHCKMEGAEAGKGAQVILYPNMPMPAFKYEGAFTEDALTKAVFKQIPGINVNKLTKVEDYKAMMKKNASKPKVILISDKKSPPVILKALSKDAVYSRTMEFGFVSKETGADVLAAIQKEKGGSKAKNTPAIFLQQVGKDRLWFKGKEVNFSAIKEWLNPYSESGMGDTVKGDTKVQEAEEAEYERIRELTWKSQRDLCFGQKNVCAVYLADGKITEAETDMLVGFENEFAKAHERGIAYNFMWLDVSLETEIKEVLVKAEAKAADNEGRDVEALKFPGMMFIKPAKTKRQEKQLAFIRMENGVKVDSSALSTVMDKIAGGATYTRVPIPKFQMRKKEEKKGGKTEL